MGQLKEIRAKILVNIKEIAIQHEKEIRDAYQRVMKLEHIARREGLLALEYEAQFLDKEMPLCHELTEMIELLVDGTEPEMLEELMTIRFFAVYNYEGIEALLYYLYARSILMIQAVTTPYLIEEFFNAVLPDTMIRFEEKRKKKISEKQQKINEWRQCLLQEEREMLENISNRLLEFSVEEWKTSTGSNGYCGFDRILPYLDEKVQVLAKEYMNEYRYYMIMSDPVCVTAKELLEEKEELEKLISRWKENGKKSSIMEEILNRSDKEIQLMLTHINVFTLSKALKGEREEIAECFYRNLSPRLRYMVQEDMEYMGPIRVSDMEEAQREILGVMKKIV